MTIDCLLVANRGEIAVRIVRAARELGLRTVVACSQADTDSLAVRLADRAVEIGPPPASKSYLNIEAILAAASDCGANAIHPGYGFLAENANFAEAVEKSDLIFVGPESDTIRRMGDKVTACEVAMRAGIPTVAGSSGRIDSPSAARAACHEDWFSRPNQGRCWRRRTGNSCRQRSRGIRPPGPSGKRGGASVLRRRWHLRGEVHSRGPTRGGAGAWGR